MSGGGQNTLFNVGMGYSAVSGVLNRFKNPQSSNDLRTYNPFRETLDAAGADNF